ncbi:MAG TPA: DUF6629 family protein [Nocardioidaceae bacterium]|nr:DUF6629 family protein [Nocardioidaceae bacterium]
MCYSATASFVGAAVVGGIGVATLTQVRRPRELPFAALPVLFAAHQATEGVVWLSLTGSAPQTAGDIAAHVYVLYAQGVLPFLVPLAIVLLEPSARRRIVIAPFLAVGAAAGGYLFWANVTEPVSYQIEHHSIAYDSSGSLATLFAVLYLAATCGSALFSGYQLIVVFGVVNLVGATASAMILASNFTSVWCAYAAAVSFVVLLFFRSLRRQEAGLSRRADAGAAA